MNEEQQSPFAALAIREGDELDHAYLDFGRFGYTIPGGKDCHYPVDVSKFTNPQQVAVVASEIKDVLKGTEASDKQIIELLESASSVNWLTKNVTFPATEAIEAVLAEL